MGGLVDQCSTACSQQRASGQLAVAVKIREELCQFQELPHHHQTSWAAPWLWSPAPPPERAKRVLPWRGPQWQDWLCLERLGQPTACPWMLLHLCWVAVLLMPRPTGGLLLGSSGLNTTCWPMATELGHFSASFPFQLLLCLFYPLANNVIVICHSLGQKLFFSEFFAQPLLQQDCNFSQHSSNVINRLCTKGNCILGGCDIRSSGQPMCFPRERGHVDWSPKWLARTFKH